MTNASLHPEFRLRWIPVAAILIPLLVLLCAGCATRGPSPDQIIAKAEATSLAPNYSEIVKECLSEDPNSMNALFAMSSRPPDRENGDPGHAWILRALLDRLGDRTFARYLDFETTEVQSLVRADIVSDLSRDPEHFPRGSNHDPIAAERAKERWPKTFPPASDEQVIEEIAGFFPDWQKRMKEAQPEVKQPKLDWRVVGRKCVAKDPVALHWMFWYCKNGDLDGGASEEYAGILDDLLENLGDRFFGTCLSREPPEVQAEVRGEINFDLWDEQIESAIMAHRRWPKTFPRG